MSSQTETPWRERTTEQRAQLLGKRIGAEPGPRDTWQYSYPGPVLGGVPFVHANGLDFPLAESYIPFLSAGQVVAHLTQGYGSIPLSVGPNIFQKCNRFAKANKFEASFLVASVHGVENPSTGWVILYWAKSWKKKLDLDMGATL